MSKISALLAMSALAAALSVSVSLPASADSFGCSYDKCLVACGNSGGKYCSYWCNQQIGDKQRSHVCK
jgi:hypothetical protein